MNSRNKEQIQKKVYKCFNIMFHVTTIHRQLSWLTFISIRDFFGVSLIYHTMEVKSLGRLQTIRPKTDFPPTRPLYSVLKSVCLSQHCSEGEGDGY